MVVILLAYFLPSVIASTRNHHQANAITWLNILTGWTGVGWLAAFIWSLTAVRLDLNSDYTKACPHCAERIMRSAAICKHCGKTTTPRIKERTRVNTPTPPTPAKASRGEKHLAARYGIEKEDGYYLYQGKRYGSLAIALKYAEAAEINK